MNVGDLRNMIEELPDNMDVVGCFGTRALWVCGLGTAQLGTPATFIDSSLGVVGGPTVFEIVLREHA